MSNSELIVIIERYKKDLITMDNAIGLIKGIVYAKELLHEVTQRSILQEQFDKSIELLDRLCMHADEDMPWEYRTKHFREVLEETIDFLKERGVKNE